MKPDADDAGPVFVLAPTPGRARRGARLVLERWPERTVLPLPRAAIASAGRSVERVVLCPPGGTVAEDVRFLAFAARRALWPSAPRTLRDAIAGLLPDLPASPLGDRARERAASALLLEGLVTLARVGRVADQDLRDWIVEHPFLVRVSDRTLASIERRGIRWSTLRPIRALAVLAGARLVRAHERWRGLLPPGTAVWRIREP